MDPVRFSSNIHALFVYSGLHVKEGLTFSQWEGDQKPQITWKSRTSPVESYMLFFTPKISPTKHIFIGGIVRHITLQLKF